VSRGQHGQRHRSAGDVGTWQRWEKEKEKTNSYLCNQYNSRGASGAVRGCPPRVRMSRKLSCGVTRSNPMHHNFLAEYAAARVLSTLILYVVAKSNSNKGLHMGLYFNIWRFGAKTQLQKGL
jgi:hypothetical protein